MPFVMVLGSELLVDWCKHAFVTKFNHIRPSVYSRFMDVLCLDFVKDGREVLPLATQIVTVGVRGSEPRGFKTGGITDHSISLSDAPYHGPDD